MVDDKLARFESNIERLVEKAFATFFGKRIQAQDIALELARAMESDLRYIQDGDNRPFAPDYYKIRINPNLHYQINARQHTLNQSFAQHLVRLAMVSNYRLANVPIVLFENDNQLQRNQFTIHASHSERQMNPTAGMKRVTIPVKNDESSTVLPQLLINTDRAVRVTKNITNIGRHGDNDIVINDDYVSRFHLQIRKRHNEYILFDINSRCGTRVNNTEVKEHRLQPGDVIHIGDTTLVFMQEKDDDHELTKTQPLE